MKKILLICLTILAGCQTKNEKASESTIEIYSVDMNIETIISIECTEFMDSFESTELKVELINEKQSVDRFLGHLDKLVLGNDRRDPDTRAKIIIKDKVNVDTICADRFSLKYRNRYYFMSDDLRKSIWTE